jgi:hypothetical protein
VILECLAATAVFALTCGAVLRVMKIYNDAAFHATKSASHSLGLPTMTSRPRSGGDQEAEAKPVSTVGPGAEPAAAKLGPLF